MTRLLDVVALLVAFPIALAGRADAQQFPLDGSPRRPFIESLSNLTPLAFGMNVDETSRALGQPLQLVSGRPGNEIYLALRNLGGSGLLSHHDRLFLQFRRGRLTGWKEAKTGCGADGSLRRNVSCRRSLVDDQRATEWMTRGTEYQAQRFGRF